MEMDFTKVKLNKEQQNNAFLIGSKAQEVGIDPDLALAFAWRENRFQTKGKSPKGATGVMQIMPANAKAYGYTVEDLQDPNHNIDIGLKLFKENLDMFDGNERAALVAYNANPNVAKRFLKNGETPESIPEETRIYLEDIDKIRPLVQRDEVVQEKTQIEDDNFSPVEPLPEHLDAEPKTTEERTPLDKAILPAAGATLGTALGFSEYMGNKPKAPTTGAPPTDPRFGTQTEFGTSGRAREAGFNLETQRRAEQAAKNKELIERMRRSGIIMQDSPVLKMGPLTATDTGLLVPPQALEGKPLTRFQKVKEGFKAIPRGVGEFIGKHSRVTGPLAGLGAGVAAENARERFERGQIGGGLLSTAEALASGIALTPTVPAPIRGIAGGLGIPLAGADYLYSKYGPQYESVTKRFPPKD
jgi:hypothetical protein